MKLVSGEDFKEVRMGTKIRNPADIQSLYFVSQRKKDKTCNISRISGKLCIFYEHFKFQAQICQLGILLKHLTRVKIVSFLVNCISVPKVKQYPDFQRCKHSVHISIQFLSSIRKKLLSVEIEVFLNLQQSLMGVQGYDMR